MKVSLKMKTKASKILTMVVPHKEILLAITREEMIYFREKSKMKAISEEAQT